MPAFQLYGDAIKSVKDLLTKKYVLDQRKLKIKTKTTDGVALTYEGKFDNKQKAGGSISAEYKKLDSVNIDKIGVSSAGRVNFDASLKNLADGLNVALKTEDGVRSAKATGPSAELVIEQQCDSFSIDASVTSALDISISALGGYEGGLFGGAIKTNSDFALNDYGGIVGYKADDYSAIIQASKQCKEFSLNISNKVNKDATIAGQVNYKVGADMPTFLLGSSYMLSEDSELQVRANCCGEIGANVTQRINSGFTLGLAAQVDAKNIASDNHKFGMEFTFSN